MQWVIGDYVIKPVAGGWCVFEGTAMVAKFDTAKEAIEWATLN
jgi:hypothetical protein